jgi:hypothetical protein
MNSLTYKEERFLDYFVFLKGEKILDRMGKVVTYSNGTVENTAEKATGEVFRTVCVLPEDPDSFTICDGVKEIRADGEYGSRIKLLADAVIKNTVC